MFACACTAGEKVNITGSRAVVKALESKGGGRRRINEIPHAEFVITEFIYQSWMAGTATTVLKTTIRGELNKSMHPGP